MFSHYSLFGAKNETLADFAPMPSGGLPELLRTLHARYMSDMPTSCCGLNRGFLHPDGQQVSVEITRRNETLCSLILYTREAVAGQLAELRAEGNTVPAAKAAAALRG